MSARFTPPRTPVIDTPVLNDERPLDRLSSIALATLMGSALAGGYLAWRNFMLLGRRRDAWIAAASFGALSAVAWFIPSDLLDLSRIGQALAGWAVAAVLQRRFLRAHKLADGPFRSRWIAVAVGAGVTGACVVMWYGGLWVLFALRH